MKRAFQFLPLIPILACLAGIPVFQASCGDDDDDGGRWVSDDDSVDDDAEDPDYRDCLDTLEYLYFECGAQFYDENGDPISYNVMSNHCEAAVVICIVECGDESEDCPAAKECLEDQCELD